MYSSSDSEHLFIRYKAEGVPQVESIMNSMEKSKLLDELFTLRKADKERETRLLEKLDRISVQLLSLNESSQVLLKPEKDDCRP